MALETKTSKATSVQATGMFTDKYKFEIAFENGDTGIVYRMTNEAKVTIGEETNYTLSPKGTIKIMPAGGGTWEDNKSNNKSNGSSSSSPKTDEQIVRMNSVTNAVAFCRGSNCSKEEIADTAQFFRNLVMNGFDTPDISVTNKDKDGLPF